MEDVGELLERLGRQIGQMERRYSRGGERFGRHFERQFERHFGFGHDEQEDTVDVEGDEIIERELVFGEQPELKVTANFMNVAIQQVAPGEKTRLVLKGHDLNAIEIETGTWDNAVGVELRLGRGLRGFGGFGHFGRRLATIYVPAGTRVRARSDAGILSAEGLQNTELDLRSDAGKLRVERCEGRLRLRSSAGKLSVNASSGDLDVRADAGKIQIDSFSGRLEARADAGSIACTRLRLQPGESTLRTSMGSIDVALLPDVPVRIETKASLGSVQNRVGEGPRDAVARLKATTDVGSIRIRYDEQPPTPLHSVSVSDERAEAPSAGSASAEPRGIPFDVEEGAAPASAATGSQPENQPAQPVAPSGTGENETLRILSMLEKHEITAAEASALLAALRRV